MNFIEFESAQKLRGGFYTDTDLAEFLTRWVAVVQPQRILEPSCGDGDFLRWFLFNARTVEAFDGVLGNPKVAFQSLA